MAKIIHINDWVNT